MKTIRVSATVAVALLGALLAAPSAHAIDKCKVKVDSKTGVIAVSATGVSGTLQWGSEAGAENQSFFNPSCVVGDKAKGCQLANPATLASKTPPAGCTIYLDDAGVPCSMWIKGCSPGQRSASPPHSLVWKDATGVTVGASDDSHQAWFYDDGSAITRIYMQGGSNFLQTGQFYYASADCTGPGLLPGDAGPIHTTMVVNSFGGPVYYAPDGGTFQAFNSSLIQDQMVMSPVDCLFFHPGSFFLGFGQCCQVGSSSAYLATPASVDFTGVTFPIAPGLE